VVDDGRVTWDFAATSSALADYFVRMETAEGSTWTPGRIAAEEWHRLVGNAAATPSELARLDGLLRKADGSSSALEELRLAVRSWRDSPGVQRK